MTIVEGMEFGAVVAVMLFGLPAVCLGAVLGPIWAFFWPTRDRSTDCPNIPDHTDYWTRLEHGHIKRLDEQGIKPQ
jgi:hypothetical protein